MTESLCMTCRWSRQVTTGKGSTLVRCGRADREARYPKYPYQPVLECRGYERQLTVNNGPGRG